MRLRSREHREPGLQPDDVARIRSIQDIFLPNAEVYVAAFKPGRLPAR